MSSGNTLLFSAAEHIVTQLKATVVESHAADICGLDDLAAEYEADSDYAAPELMPLCRNTDGKRAPPPGHDALSSPTAHSATSCSTLLEDAFHEDDDDAHLDAKAHLEEGIGDTEADAEIDDAWAAYDRESSLRDGDLAMLPPGQLAKSQKTWKEPSPFASIALHSLAAKRTAATRPVGAYADTTTSTVGLRRNVSIFDDGVPVLSCLSPSWGKCTTCTVTPALRRSAVTSYMTMATTPKAAAILKSSSKTPPTANAASSNNTPSTEPPESAPAEVQLPVHLTDGTCVTVTARVDDCAGAVVAAVASRVGVPSEHHSSLSLYVATDLEPRPEHRITPTTRVSALEWIPVKTKGKLVLAVRMFTAHLLRVARRGCRHRASQADVAIAHLVYAQAVANVMSGALPLPALLPPRLKPDSCRRKGDDSDDDISAEIDMDPLAEFLRKRRGDSVSSAPSNMSRDDQHDAEYAASWQSDDEDPDLLSAEEASAVRLGALRLWSRAGELIEESKEQHMGVLSAAVRLVTDYGVARFLPPIEEDDNAARGADFWKARLLTELDYLLKQQVRMGKKLRKSDSSSFSEKDNSITIEVFEIDKRNKDALHTITVKRIPEPTATSTQHRRSANQGVAYALLGTACFLRLASLSPLFGASIFPCWARRRAIGEASDDDDAAAELTRRAGGANLRLLAISRDGVVFRNDKLRLVETISITSLRRWICNGAEHSVRFESERDLITATNASRPRNAKASYRLASKSRARLRKCLRRAAESAPAESLLLCHPKPQQSHAEAALAEKKKRSLSVPPPRPLSEEGHQSTDVDDDSVGVKPGIVDWARSLFTQQDSESSMSIGERVHAVLDGDDDGSHDDWSDVDDDDDVGATSGGGLIYELRLVVPLAKSTDQATEIVTLLDDYSQYYQLQNKPKCKYESAFAPQPSPSKNRPADLQSSRPCTSRSQADMADEEAKELFGGRSTVYKALVSAVIRPPRFVYDTRLLGPSSFDFAGSRIFRQDLVLRNKDGLRLHCSHWKPVAAACANGNHLESMLQYKSPRHSPYRPARSHTFPSTPGVDEGAQSTTPVVIFMHANSASRVQACTYLSVVLSLGYSLFAFDCAGSGLSEGEHVTLGWCEACDLLVVCTYLKNQGHSQIAVWGHSMGAAAAIYYQSFGRGKNWPKLDACVLDSPYSDFSVLADHLVKGNAVITHAFAQYLASFSIAQTAIKLLLDSIDASVQKIVNVSPISDLSPIARAPHCTAPALFLQARHDKIIAMSHVEDLANQYAGPRKLAIIDGTHSSPRNGAARKFVALYLKKHLKVSAEHRYPSSTRTRDGYLEALPWQRHRASLPFIPV